MTHDMKHQDNSAIETKESGRRGFIKLKVQHRVRYYSHNNKASSSQNNKLLDKITEVNEKFAEERRQLANRVQKLTERSFGEWRSEDDALNGRDEASAPKQPWPSGEVVEASVLASEPLIDAAAVKASLSSAPLKTSTPLLDPALVKTSAPLKTSTPLETFAPVKTSVPLLAPALVKSSAPLEAFAPGTTSKPRSVHAPAPEAGARNGHASLICYVAGGVVCGVVMVTAAAIYMCCTCLKIKYFDPIL